MFKGILNPQSIINIDELQLVVIGYGNCYRLYHKYKQTCITQLNPGHTSHIICTQLHHSLLYSIDQSGLLILFNLQTQPISPSIVQKVNINHKIQDCRIYPNEDDEIILLFINNEKHLHKYNINTQQYTQILPTLKFNRIIAFTHPLAIVKQSDHHIYIINTNNNQVIKQYQHTHTITSATIHQNDIIIGDQKGKIYILHQLIDQSQHNTTKLQWHVGPVNSLQSVGHYLYSGGQESVVVMWHLSQMSRDFLPRIGTSIQAIHVQQQTNEIICAMADSSVKVIVMNNDKQLRTYKTIVDPFGYAKGDQKTRFNNDNMNEYNGMLCLNSVPGRLQFINTSMNGMNNEVQIVNRNLTCGLDKQQPTPHHISFTCFSPQWHYALVSVETMAQEYHHNVIKFYKRTVQYNLQLMNQVHNPHHHSKMSGCKYMQYQQQQAFITYSKGDSKIRVWSIVRRKKQSLLEGEQVYWNCIIQYSYRSLKPISIDTFENMCIITYQHQILVLKNMKQIQHYPISQVQQSHIFSQNTYLICYSDKIQLWDNQKINITLHQHHLKSIAKNNNHIALLTNYQHHHKLIILNTHNYSIYKCYQFNINIQSIIFKNHQLLIISEHIHILTLNIQDDKEEAFIKYKNQEEDQRKQVITDIQETNMQNEDIQFQELYQRHIKRSNTHNKPSQIINHIHSIPSTTVSAQMLMSHMFI